MTLLKIILLQTALFIMAAVFAGLLSGLLVTSSFPILKRPTGFLIVSLFNALPYIAGGTLLAGLVHMNVLRAVSATIVFAFALIAFQGLSVFVSAQSLGLTRYEGHVPLFIDGVVTPAGLAVRMADILAATAAFFLSLKLMGTFRREWKI